MEEKVSSFPEERPFNTVLRRSLIVLPAVALAVLLILFILPDKKPSYYITPETQLVLVVHQPLNGGLLPSDDWTNTALGKAMLPFQATFLDPVLKQGGLDAPNWVQAYLTFDSLTQVLPSLCILNGESMPQMANAALALFQSGKGYKVNSYQFEGWDIHKVLHDESGQTLCFSKRQHVIMLAKETFLLEQAIRNAERDPSQSALHQAMNKLPEKAGTWLVAHPGLSRDLTLGAISQSVALQIKGRKSGGYQLDWQPNGIVGVSHELISQLAADVSGFVSNLKAPKPFVWAKGASGTVHYVYEPKVNEFWPGLRGMTRHTMLVKNIGLLKLAYSDLLDREARLSMPPLTDSVWVTYTGKTLLIGEAAAPVASARAAIESGNTWAKTQANTMASWGKLDSLVMVHPSVINGYALFITGCSGSQPRWRAALAAIDPQYLEEAEARLHLEVLDSTLTQQSITALSVAPSGGSIPMLAGGNLQVLKDDSVKLMTLPSGFKPLGIQAFSYASQSYVLVNGGNQLLLLNTDGSIRAKIALAAPFKCQTAKAIVYERENKLRFLATDPNGRLLLLDENLLPLPGWEKELSAPIMGDVAYGYLAGTDFLYAQDQGGGFHLWKRDGSYYPGFPVAMSGVYSSAPIWVPTENNLAQSYFLTLSASGAMQALSFQGKVKATRQFILAEGSQGYALLGNASAPFAVSYKAEGIADFYPAVLEGQPQVLQTRLLGRKDLYLRFLSHQNKVIELCYRQEKRLATIHIGKQSYSFVSTVPPQLLSNGGQTIVVYAVGKALVRALIVY